MEVVVTAVAEAAITGFFETLFKSIPRFFEENKKVEKEINEWKQIWKCLKGFLCDAENKQFSNDEVRVWLQDLEHLAYDAEDLLQLLNYKELKSQIETKKPAKLNTLQKVSNLICWKKSPKIDSMVKNDLKSITEKLHDLVKRKELLNLLEIPSNDQSYTNQGPSRIPSASLPPFRLYGREDEKRSLVNLLLQQEEGGSTIEVIPIVGMGGIGKTTLVQHVYNDENVVNFFDTKIWICVSKDYDRLRIMRGIMESIMSTKLFDFQDLSLIEEKICKALRNKKLLLVLDDYWNDSYGEWLNLCAPLLAAAPGSKIMVTTRSAAIADSIKTVHEYIHLLSLSEEDCWSLFCEHARLNSTENSRFVEIGREIVKRCAKLPLAVMTMGGILRSKTREEQWESVRNSKLWTKDNEVMPILRMSYNDLSSNLKRCFSFCAMLPEDYEFSEQKVVQLWMGAGLISYDGTSENDLSMEDRGRELFQDLLSRCLILKIRENDVYVMHDLVRELAQQISGTTCCNLVQLSTLPMESVERCRYLSFWSAILVRTTRNLNNLNMSFKLRTFVALPANFGNICVIKKDLSVLLTNMRYLRNLSLSQYGDSELPESLSMLKLLRYLDLNRSQLTKLPNSLTLLHNLECLNLSDCKLLNELPSDIGRLTNLWCLDISESGIEKELPKGLQELKKLRRLSNFIVGGRNGLSVTALEGMTFLKGELNVSSLENVTSVEDVRKAKLREKKIDDLSLEWNQMSETCEDSAVLEELQPQANLKTLALKNYNGKIMCTWLEATKLRQLNELDLHGCERCTKLPAMGLFPFLKHASVKSMNALERVGMEWYGSSSDVFPKLETLRFEGLEELQEWECYDGVHFPTMIELRITNCPRLFIPKCRDLLASMPKLTMLSVDSCEELELSLPQLPLIRVLLVWCCKEVTCVELFNLDSLQRFCCNSRMSDLLKEKVKNGIHGVRSLDIGKHVIEESEGEYSEVELPYWALPSLGLVADDEDGGTRNEMKLLDLSVYGVNNEDLPTWICDAVFLRNISLTDCASLKALPALQQLLCLEELLIENCPNLMFAEDMIPSSLRVLGISDECSVAVKCPEIIHKFTSLTKIFMDSCMCNLIRKSGISFPNLQYLIVRDSHEIKAFPEDDMSLLFPNLSNLYVQYFFDLAHLTSLKGFKFLHYLVLECCPQLEMLSELPLSLLQVSFHYCDLIKQKVDEFDAELVAQISEVPTIWINGKHLLLM